MTEPGSDGGSNEWWVWVVIALVGIFVVSGVIALVRRSPKPAAAPPRGRASQAVALLDESDELSTHIIALAPDRVRSVAAADAARLAALHAAIEQLRGSVADEVSIQALGALDAPMRSLHAALDAIALGPPSPLNDADGAELRARATALHVETSLARATLFPPPATPL